MKYLCSWMGVIGVCLTAGLFAQVPAHNSFNCKRADSVAATYYNHSLSDMRGLAQKLTQPLPTQHEKYRAIFRWVCDNIRSDYQLNGKVKQIRQRYQTDKASLDVWNRKLNEELITRLREKRSTVCTGYAYLVWILAQHAGLTCQIVNGYARTSLVNLGGEGTPNHNWNAVQLEGVWYLSDATWADGQVLGADGWQSHFNESYFLVKPASFIHSHFPLDTAQLFLSHKPRLSDFLQAPLVYAASYDFGLHAKTPADFYFIVRKGDPVSFVVQQEQGNSFHKLALQVNEAEVVQLAGECEGKRDTTYQLTHTFTSRGLTAVHVVADGRPVYSYRVHVK
jgi:hypothetical protein